ncbi:50S ribosomal protein L4 [Candidatus Microgenomates bacterium]|nr:50S ribosomal protein L4 [Candidatus Microgenomates bacterium]
MPRIDIYNIKEEKTGKIQLPEEFFGAVVNKQLMAQAIRIYLANQRKARAKTKTRGQVTGSGIKIYRQKGTGRARHGDRYAPIFVGGGVTHGPRGIKNRRLKMSKKMRRKAFFSALTSKFKEKKIVVIKDLEKINPKTKKMAKVLDKIINRKPATLKTQKKKKTQKILLILPNVLENVMRAGRNIPSLKTIQAKQLNTYEVLNGGLLVFMKSSIKTLKETFSK